MNAQIKNAIDKVYKKVIGKNYRDQMVTQNETELHTSINDVTHNNLSFEFYSTSHEVYKDEYKKFLKNMKGDSEKNVIKQEHYEALELSYFIILICSFTFVLSIMVCFFQFFFDADKNLYPIGVILTCPIAIIFGIFYKKYALSHLTTSILKGEYEKSKASEFFNGYKTGLGLQDEHLIFYKDNKVKYINYTAIRGVYLSGKDESSFSEDNPSKFRNLDIVMSDDKVYTILEPVGPNGENIEQLRDIIMEKMHIAVDNNDLYYDDQILNNCIYVNGVNV